MIRAGSITINVEGTLLLLVLIFGAGTDYSLLLIHRYREELDRGLPLPAGQNGLLAPACLRSG